MTDKEKRIHDISIAILQANIAPMSNDDDYIQYVKNWTDFYLHLYDSVKHNLEYK